MQGEYLIKANPIRIIPFDLGRTLTERDICEIQLHATKHGSIKELTNRQASILKRCVLAYCINEHVLIYLYKNGIAVVVIDEEIIEISDEYETFSIPYDENRKQAHTALFNWEHKYSALIKKTICELKRIVALNMTKKQKLRISCRDDFENSGLSYIMTLSLFDIPKESLTPNGFKNYPKWLQNNIHALLDPSLLYLEDSSKFSVASDSVFDPKKLLSSLDIENVPFDYERHKNISTYMSWAAVVVIGQLLDTDKEEYVSLEVQLQCDWFYVYCIEKNMPVESKINKNDIIYSQRQSYELDLLENRLFDFDDSSMPARVLDIQKGLIETSGLANNIQHLQRKIRYLLERAQMETEIKQKRIGQSTEILLFVIAYIEVAPVIAEYGNNIFPFGGIIANILLLITGIFLLCCSK